MAIRIKFGDQSFGLPLGESLIGRDSVCRIQLEHRSVSRRHARILLVGETPTLEDLGSRNGTFLDGVRLGGPAALYDGAEVRVGTQVFTVQQEGGKWSTVETEQSRGALPTSYQVPEMRTCLGCRHLVGPRDASCPKCGLEQRRPTEIGVTTKIYIDPMGRRANRRFSVKLRGLYVSPNITLECEILDISLAGAFVQADLLDEPNTTCDIVVFVAQDDVVRLAGQVVRNDRRMGKEGMGVRFGELGPAATLWITAVIGNAETDIV